MNSSQHIRCWNDAEHFVLITGIHLKYIQIKISYLKYKNYFTVLLLLLYFGSNKCRLGEQKRILWKTLQILLFKNLTGSWLVCETQPFRSGLYSPPVSVSSFVFCIDVKVSHSSFGVLRETVFTVNKAKTIDVFPLNPFLFFYQH